MNIRFLIASLALGLLAVGGCTGPTVITDYDPSTEFSAFRTFAFTGLKAKGDDVGVLDNSLLRKRIEAMVDRQLTAKGLRQVRVEGPSDLLVYLLVGVKDKQRIESTGMAGGAYGGRFGRGGGFYGGGVTTYEYEEGTLIVDLTESSKKELVWRATIRGVLGDSVEKNSEMVDKGVAKAFEAYPPAKKK